MEIRLGPMWELTMQLVQISRARSPWVSRSFPQIRQSGTSVAVTELVRRALDDIFDRFCYGGSWGESNWFLVADPIAECIGGVSSAAIRIATVVGFFDPLAVVAEHLLEIVDQFGAGGVDFDMGNAFGVAENGVDGIDAVGDGRVGFGHADFDRSAVNPHFICDELVFGASGGGVAGSSGCIAIDPDFAAMGGVNVAEVLAHFGDGAGIFEHEFAEDVEVVAVALSDESNEGFDVEVPQPAQGSSPLGFELGTDVQAGLEAGIGAGAGEARE